MAAGEFLWRRGDTGMAMGHFSGALDMVRTEPERRFVMRRLAALSRQRIGLEMARSWVSVFYSLERRRPHSSRLQPRLDVPCLAALERRSCNRASTGTTVYRPVSTVLAAVRRHPPNPNGLGGPRRRPEPHARVSWQMIFPNLQFPPDSSSIWLPGPHFSLNRADCCRAQSSYG
jgi:hypothetical protein